MDLTPAYSGLTPVVFQALINDVFCYELSKFFFVYLDDFLIFSETEEEHKQNLRLVLRHLLENSLFVKIEKSKFYVTTVAFLRFVVKQGQLLPDPFKIQAVAEMPSLTSQKQLQQLLGFANF